MCGIFGVAAAGRRPSIDERTAVALRDRLAHRGPDESGLWSDERVHLGHRRLAVVDPGGGRQPMVIGGPDDPDRLVLTYNGELHDDRGLREELEALGARFERTCDTEIVARALHRWGDEAIRRLRGMFAFAVYRPNRRTLTLVRDPLGIKPLLFAVVDVPGGAEVVFASEPAAVLGHPAMPVRPDLETLAGYLVTIRTSIGDRTLHEGVRCLRPGEKIEIDLRGDRPRLVARRWWRPPPVRETLGGDIERMAALTRGVVERSIDAHLPAAQPLAVLLSGGLDSSIVCRQGARAGRPVRSFCAWTDDPAGRAERAHARLVAEACGTEHHELRLDRSTFESRWPALVESVGGPLSTPNEIAIEAIGRAVRAHGPVALSGEGADELFAGYGGILALAAAAVDRLGPAPDARSLAEVIVRTIAWVPPEGLDELLGGADGVDRTAALRAVLEHELERVEAGGSALDRCLRVLMATNLEGLLGRLDRALMQSSVEGRVPIADVVVAVHAQGLPVALHADLRASRAVACGAGPVPEPGAAETKRLLRAAFADALPRAVVTRPKASFPLPFQGWMGSVAAEAIRSPSARSVFRPAALEAIAAGPGARWSVAWPVLNACLWLRRFD